MEEGCWIPKTLQARRSLVKLLNCKYVFILKKKFRRMTLRVKSWAQRLEPRTIVDCAQTLKPYVTCPAEF